MKELLGAWSGTMTHEGESQPFTLELEPADENQVSLRLTLPAMNMARQPVATLKRELLGNVLMLGPFTFTYDGEAQTLSGTMPAAMVPVYEIPVILQRVESVETSARPELAAPLAEPAWSVDTGAPLWAGATYADGVVYAGDDEGRLHALDARSGAKRWSFPAGGPIRTRATIAGGAVFWKADVYGWAWGRPAVTDGRVFVGTAALRGDQNDVHLGGVVALDRTTGRAVWRFALESPDEGAWGCFPGSPAVGAGHVLVTGLGGRVLAFAQ
jgi:hypothetical protein